MLCDLKDNYLTNIFTNRNWRFVTQAFIEAEDGARLISNEQGKIIISNSKGRKLWANRNPYDVIKENVVAIHGEENDHVTAVESLRVAAKMFFPETIEIEMRSIDNIKQNEWYRISVTPLLNPQDSKRKLILWRADEITPERNITETLMQERSFLGDFLDYLSLGVYAVTSSGNFKYVNLKMAEWLGENQDDLIGKSLKSFIVGTEIPDSDGTWKGIVKFRGANGDTFKAFISHTLHDDEGETITRAAVVKDIIQEQRLEHALKTAELRSNWLFNEAPVGIAFVDIDGTILDCNPYLAGMLKRTVSEVIGENVTENITRELREDIGSQLSKVLMGTAKNSHVEAKLLIKNNPPGTETMVSMFISPMHENEEEQTSPAKSKHPSQDISTIENVIPENKEYKTKDIDGFIIHFVDTTERKNLEVQFAQAQKMQAMGQLAGGIAHDFNNLLTAMIGFSDLLLQRHGPGDPSFSDIMQIKQNSNRAANLVRQLLAFSRLQPLRPRILNVTEALTELSHLLRRLIGENVTLKFEHGRNIDYIKVDQGQFDQVVINLSVNARDAINMRGGNGTLTIRTRLYTVEEPLPCGEDIIPPGEFVTIEISDTGCGISNEQIGRIFEPFFTTKEGKAGTGLGLSTVYGIIRQTEGFINVSSAEGEGTSFVIYLPHYKEEDVAKEENQDETSSFAINDKDAPIQIIEKQNDILEARNRQLNLFDLQSKNKTIEIEEASEIKEEKQTTKKQSINKAIKEDITTPAPAVPSYMKSYKSTHNVTASLTGNAKILLVEDEDAVRAFSARALTNKGYTILTADSAETALSMFEKNQDIDLLITDMIMPGMDGASLAKIIHEKNSKIKIILMSGYSEEIARKDLADADYFHFLSKPFTLNVLASKVKSVMDE